jgi:DNA repair protein RecN (Recombination protein N)
VLAEIRIRGLGVIADAVLEFGPGLTAVTGETGAGKTMVITGLGLLFGGRVDASRLRPGVESASVEGRLTVGEQSPAALAVIEAGGDLETSGEETSLILRRVLSASGRSRAVAGGASVPAGLLSRLAAELVVVHGQSDQLRLAQPAQQRGTLDRYAGLDLAGCQAAFEHWRDAQRELDQRRDSSRELAREADLLRAGLAEIESAAPTPGEDVELAVLSARLEHADALRVAVAVCRDALSSDSDSAEPDRADVGSLLAGARRALEQVTGTDRELDELAVRIAGLSADATDIATELTSYDAHLDADPERLSQVFTRRAVLQSLTRKYGADIAEVLSWAARAQQRLADTDTSDGALAELASRRDEARARYGALAAVLSSKRAAAAAKLSELITAELAGLGMVSAAVAVSVRRRSASQSQPSLDLDGQLVGASGDGIDEVEITLRPHPDAPALPVQRGASGGELSRVMLAIEVVLAGTDPVATMVFDEVDAGVGGRAAVEIGRRLALLARDHQVIVVTHLAQVAAFADQHLIVDKTVADNTVAGAEVAGAEIAGKTDSDGLTRSDIRAVTGEDRVAELARMLAGADTAAARQHAAELLDSARAGAVGT